MALVDFWATWCAPCRKEMPGFEELQKKYRDRGLVVIGIALDSDGGEVAKFARELGVTYRLLLSQSEVEKSWGGILGIPTTFLVDREKGKPVRKLALYSHDGRLLDARDTALKPRGARRWRPLSA